MTLRRGIICSVEQEAHSHYFGPATFEALVKYQNANANTILVPNGLTAGTGYFGPSTMKVVNGVVGR